MEHTSRRRQQRRGDHLAHGTRTSTRNVKIFLCVQEGVTVREYLDSRVHLAVWVLAFPACSFELHDQMSVQERVFTFARMACNMSFVGSDPRTRSLVSSARGLIWFAISLACVACDSSTSNAEYWPP